ncbi:Hypothetical predicted protein [Xyrichtys novacula]|uniref:Uncharacterized protein n=1 Tax=Xyrichtys novacula TaxID=13765 RepID=A0AAV1GP16_XYRNO|nr:Hypothetical predicted protein [Xyrichtys novacula]
MDLVKLSLLIDADNKFIPGKRPSLLQMIQSNVEDDLRKLVKDSETPNTTATSKKSPF